MEMNVNIETAESVKEKAKAAFGFDLPSALDLVNRSDYDSDEAYLDACAKELSEKKKDSKASNVLFNAMLRGQM